MNDQSQFGTGIIKDIFDEEIFGRCMESEDESFLGNVIAIEVTPRG